MISLTKKTVSLGVAALALASLGSAAEGAVLGIAAGYNEFILGNVSYQNSDVQGKMAVGGNLTATGMSLADKAGAGNNIIVGGNFTDTNGSVTGNIIAGGNVTYTNPTVSGTISANGAVTLSSGSGPTGVRYGTTYSGAAYYPFTPVQGVTTVPINFAAEFQNLKNLSLAQVNAADPAALYQYSQAYFNATPGTGVKAFNVSASTVAAATSGYNINAEAGATVVINVSGASANIINTGFNLTGGIAAEHVIWNFYEATTLNFDGSVTGTVLAPKAAVTASYGGFNGTLIAASLGGMGGGATSLEMHTMMNGGGANTLFTGTLRDIPVVQADAVPEPATLGLFGMGAVVLGLRRKRSR